jgi:hypothetical protein
LFHQQCCLHDFACGHAFRGTAGREPIPQ